MRYYTIEMDGCKGATSFLDARLFLLEIITILFGGRSFFICQPLIPSSANIIRKQTSPKMSLKEIGFIGC